MLFRESLQLDFAGDKGTVLENGTKCTGFTALGLLHLLVNQN